MTTRQCLHVMATWIDASGTRHPTVQLEAILVGEALIVAMPNGDAICFPAFNASGVSEWRSSHVPGCIEVRRTEDTTS